MVGISAEDPVSGRYESRDATGQYLGQALGGPSGQHLVLQRISVLWAHSFEQYLRNP